MLARLALALWLTIAVATPAHAHLASDSYLRIELGEDGTIRGQWDIALRDLDYAIGLDDNGTKRVLRHYEATRKGSH